jgi:hypothetical protein
MDGLGSFGTSPLHYRAYQNFEYRDFAICEGKVSCLLSFPDAETPRRRPAATCPFDGRRRPSAKINSYDPFWDDQWSQLNPVFPQSHSPLTPFRGFGDRDFATREDKGTCPFIFPGAETPERLPAATYTPSNERSSLFHDFATRDP